MTQRRRRMIACIGALCLSACGGDDGVPGAGEWQRSNLPPAIAALPLDCATGVEQAAGAYRIENNSWGRGELVDWRQCVAIGADPEGDGVIARWQWDWPRGEDNVKAYPAIVYGQKPGHPSSDPQWPVALADIAALDAHWRIESRTRGRGNAAFDLWLVDAPRADTFDVPPISHEIMIWLNHWGDMPPGGRFRERVRVGGDEYELWVGDGFGMGWRYLAFRNLRSRLHARSLDLRPFFDVLLERGLIDADAYLASVEFGNEVVHGRGETRLLHYALTLERRADGPAAPAPPASDAARTP